MIHLEPLSIRPPPPLINMQKELAPVGRGLLFSGVLLQTDFPEMSVESRRRGGGGRFIFVFQKTVHNKYSLMCR